MSNRAFKALIPNAWYVAAWSYELEDKPLGRKLLNEDIVLFRDTQGKVGALEDRCCHRAAPLTMGTVVEAGLQCGYHGLTFDCSGKCVVNPGEDPGKLRVRSYPIVEQQKFVWIWMGDPALADPSRILDFPYHDQEDEWPFQYGRYDINGNYTLMMDNLMDISHLGYVHPDTIGGTPKHHVDATQETVQTENGVQFMRWMLDSPPPPTFVKAVGFKGKIDRWANFEYVAPGTVLQWSGGLDIGKGAQENQNQEGAFRLRLYHGVTPKTDSTCHYFWSVANGYRQDDPQAAEDLYNEIAPTFREDQAIVEGQMQSLLRDPKRPLITRQHDVAIPLSHRALDRFSDAAEALGKRVAAE